MMTYYRVEERIHGDKELWVAVCDGKVVTHQAGVAKVKKLLDQDRTARLVRVEELVVFPVTGCDQKRNGENYNPEGEVSGDG